MDSNGDSSDLELNHDAASFIATDHIHRLAIGTAVTIQIPHTYFIFRNSGWGRLSYFFAIGWNIGNETNRRTQRQCSETEIIQQATGRYQVWRKRIDLPNHHKAFGGP